MRTIILRPCRPHLHWTLSLSMLCVAGHSFHAEAQQPTNIIVSEQAQRIHQSAILIDGHNDLPWAIRKEGMPSFQQFDIAQPKPQLQTDIPRLRSGGMGAQFWSVYVPSDTTKTGKALQTTLEQIDLVHRMIEHYPDTFELARTSHDIRRIRAEGRIASLIGVEGGHSIENSLNVLRRLHELGAAYMTLTHSDTLAWADSATDTSQHGGLTPFGEAVVREMNRLGMLVDISHVSVETMEDALRVSQAPIIFSHSSARALADHPRNVPDAILKQTAINGGVVLVNFYPTFIVPAAVDRWKKRESMRNGLRVSLDDASIEQKLANWDTANPIPRGTILDVVDHIGHIAMVAGVDHVGIGSDFDGIGAVPVGLEDVSHFPRITQLLLDRGFSESDIRKILGENVLRVMTRAEAVAKELQN
ncbi:MAG: dipeptidase [Pirellulaceae bacterium]|nr:dipeptidase [Planctomycetales bacterium]